MRTLKATEVSSRPRMAGSLCWSVDVTVVDFMSHTTLLLLRSCAAKAFRQNYASLPICPYAVCNA